MDAIILDCSVSIDELRYVKPVSVENEDNYKELVKEVRGEKNE